ncbi:MAG TPA: hypothetical protein ENI32_04055 [Candidatus Syntrophoarchaeum butanivorans]|uniref:Uncharacterized protein n=1 Tax=Candidatus Syntropharchaeum butanivorans TaxID=1839936 RepID=A0A1F2P5M7_9EURY|nr:MAG: hypothetical protein SBU_000441 [Candidatus Syntrophoarchaeum butanivorans]HEC57042.1 hypothetical protein [Candidatus Syntrophoarchaeum butanivorans]
MHAKVKRLGDKLAEVDSLSRSGMEKNRGDGWERELVSVAFIIHERLLFMRGSDLGFDLGEGVKSKYSTDLIEEVIYLFSKHSSW